LADVFRYLLTSIQAPDLRHSRSDSRGNMGRPTYERLWRAPDSGLTRACFARGAEPFRFPRTRGERTS